MTSLPLWQVGTGHYGVSANQYTDINGSNIVDISGTVIAGINESTVEMVNGAANGYEGKTDFTHQVEGAGQPGNDASAEQINAEVIHEPEHSGQFPVDISIQSEQSVNTACDDKQDVQIIVQDNTDNGVT